ncbi:MAG: site-specific DNA-methyltransferase, partial [Methanothrix sp.]|nr:site-specific DNA-methyltransferase [Methanothrix sp.]
MSDPVRWGPDNPHPLSQLRTELVWDGKYDEYGRRRSVDVAGAACPGQKIETVDMPRSEALASGQTTFGELSTTLQEDFRNRLIWGDNKLVMASLLKDFRGRIDLIYIDPPFDVGADFTMQVPVGEEKDAVRKDQSLLEMVAYRDMWGKGSDSYLHMMYERLTIMSELLKESGCIIVHLGDKVASEMRGVMDDVFGNINYRNSIIIPRGIKNVQAQFEDVRALSVGHDVLLFYSKTDSKRIPKLTLPGASNEKGKWDTFWRGTDRPTMRYELFGKLPKTGQWRWSKDRAYHAKDNYEEFLRQEKSSNRSLDDYYSEFLNIGTDLDFLRLGPDDNVQYYVPPRDYKLASTLWSSVRTRGTISEYATEKNEELIEVIVNWLSKPNDLVADLFCGSGTTGAVAERLGRRWIMCDLGRFAIHTSRKRLIELQRRLQADGKPYRAFDVYNLGRYERQWWQRERLQGYDNDHRRVVLGFYRAEPLARPTTWLHGRKGGAFVYVDGIDSLLTRDEVKAAAQEAHAAGGRELHCLAWEFEMDLRLVAQEIEASEGVHIRLLTIPREIMEKNRTDAPPFFEVAVLEAEAVYSKVAGKKKVDIRLKKFLPSLAEVPAKELAALKERAAKDGFDFIDF